MNYQALASQGRYGDTTLVHMTPQEVSGLNALGAAYGRPMTINPTTGYPEAFNLRNLLPMVIGTGLNIASGGALTPLQAGMITGAGYTLATGDIQKGITAGFGAAGGAGFGEGLTAAGSAAMPVQGASTVAENFARAGEGFKALGSGDGINAFMGSPATSAVPATGVGGVGGLAKSASMALAPELSDRMTPPAPPEQVSYMRPYSLDIENVSGGAPSSSAERQQLTYSFKEEDPFRVAQGGHIKAYQEGGAVSGESAPVRAPVSDVYQNIANVQRMAGLQAIDVPTFDPTTYDVGTGFGMKRYNELRNLGVPLQDMRAIAARAPIVGPRAQAMLDATPMSPMEMGPAPSMGFKAQDYGIRLPDPTESKSYQEIQERGTFKKPMFGRSFGGDDSESFSTSGRPIIGYTEEGQPIYGASNSIQYAAQGGLTSLREGRFLRGDGDGMSDEIPASIEGEVDALLSDGEFVIPADVVSHLGNGSSEAGAKVLYEMMDRVRRERTGKEEQAKEIPVEKVVPA